MSRDEPANDTTLTRDLRDSLSGLALAERPALADIVDRGRAHQRRRLAGLGAVAVASSTALAVGLTGVVGSAAARGGVPTASPTRSTGSSLTAAFTLTRNANGTVTLTLRTSQVLDAAALQRALAQDRIPALVRTGSYCSSDPAPPDPLSLGVLSVRLPSGGRLPAPANARPDMNRLIDNTKTVIDPAAMPSGTELFFGYGNDGHAVYVGLIYTRSYTCSDQPPPNQ